LESEVVLIEEIVGGFCDAAVIGVCGGGLGEVLIEMAVYDVR
jgi:hypothetical protein